MSVSTDSDITGISTGGGTWGSITGSISDQADLQAALDAKVAGPASAADNAIARYDGVTGKIIQNSNIMIADADAQGSVGFSIVPASPITYMFVRGGVSKGDVGFGATQKIASVTVKALGDVTITGTTTANSTPNITISGGLALEELSELDRIAPSSSASNFKHIKSITSNAAVVIENAMGNGTTQTIGRRRAIQTWRDSSDNFVAGFTDYGSFLIGSPNASIYNANKILGALTVNSNGSSSALASFHTGGVWKSHVNVDGFYKFVYGNNADQDQRIAGCTVITDGNNSFSTGGGGGLQLLTTYTVKADTFVRDGDTIEFFLSGSTGATISVPGPQFAFDFAGVNIFTWTPPTVGVDYWSARITIMLSGTVFKSNVSMTVGNSGSGEGETYTSYFEDTFDPTVGQDFNIQADDNATAELFLKFAKMEWYCAQDA